MPSLHDHRQCRTYLETFWLIMNIILYMNESALPCPRRGSEETLIMNKMSREEKLHRCNLNLHKQP